MRAYTASQWLLLLMILVLVCFPSLAHTLMGDYRTLFAIYAVVTTLGRIIEHPVPHSSQRPG